MSETSQTKRNIRRYGIAAVVILLACFVILGVLTLFGPVLSPLIGSGGNVLSDKGQCSAAVAAYQKPGGGMDLLGKFTLSVPGKPITTDNASHLGELEHFTQPGPRLDQTIAIDSAGEVLIYQLPPGSSEMSAANHDASKLITVENYPGSQEISAVRVCDMTTAKQIAAFLSDETTNAVAFTPDGAKFLINEGRGTIGIFNAETNARIERWDVRQGQPWRSTGHLAISPDDALAAFSVDNNASNVSKAGILVWNIATNSQLAILEGHTGAVISLAFSPDETRLVSYGMDGLIRVWGIPDAQN